MSAFYKYFKENMDGIDLPAPEGLSGSAQAAVVQRWPAMRSYRADAAEASGFKW